MAGNRRYYSEYVGHFVRFYLIYPGMTRFRTPAEKKMYEVVGEVWSEMTETEKEIIKHLYLTKATFNTEVANISETMGLQPNSVWKMIARFETEIASAGGLI